MALQSSIEWTEATWNPMTGCSRISPGCLNCYAERLAKRLKAMGQPNYINGFRLTPHPHMLDLPLGWKKPKMIFVNSMSDIFHEDAPTEYIESIFQVMNDASWHIFQLLTKRSERLAKFSGRISWESNIWMGVTIESADYLFRADHLRQTGARVKFLSLEPLLSPMPDIDLKNINWVIVGGESGPHSRPMDIKWVLDIQQQCEKRDVPFFFKQWGGWNKKKNGRLLNGKTWDGMPKVA